MKYLIITAHPGKKGHTKNIAKSFFDTVKKEDATAEIINLYDKKWKQEFLTFETASDIDSNKIIKQIQQKITDADCLVFIFPIWWNDAPALLKNFIDINFASGFAYHFTKKGPVGLLHKRAYVFATADGTSFVYNFIFAPLRLTWTKMRLGFCGIDTKKFTVFGMMRKKTEADHQGLLQKVSNIAQKDIQKYSK